MKFSAARRDDPLLDMTPMIDIVFQLVLFFMVSTTFVNAPGFQVDLPRSSAQTVIAEKEDINVWMTCGARGEGGLCAEGAVFVDDEPVTVAALDGIFDKAARKAPNTMVIIKADQGVQHGRVVTVMDMARGKGLTRLAIATEASQDDE